MPSVAIIGTRGYPSYYGGFETAVRKLAPFLADSGWDVTVYGRPGAVDLDDDSRDPRIASVLTKGLETRSLSTLSHGLSAATHATFKAPDVALVMNVANGFFLPLLKARGIPTLVNVDGMEWERAKWGLAAKTMFKFGAKLTAKFADALVYDSERIADRWTDQFNRAGHYIPYGGDPSPRLIVEDGLTHRGYALMVARFVPENTVAEFFEAAEIIGRRYPVVIVGSAAHGGALEHAAALLAKSSSDVRMLGHVHDDNRLQSLWQHAGAYFHGHSVGGTNPALVQSMAVGAPAIALDTDFNREVLADAGRFVTADAAGIADAVLLLLADPNAQEFLSGAAMTRARSNFTWDSVCSAYEAALRDLISSHPDKLSASRIA
jgi:glycosyltransferase involved in cell wall biosynthesis